MKGLGRWYPLPCKTVFLGVNKSDQTGTRFVLRAVDYWTGHPSRNVYTGHAVNTGYADSGSLTSTYSVRSRVKHRRHDILMIDHGSGHFTGGTGAYSGITGDLSYTGRNSTKERVLEYPWEATITLP